MKEINITEKYTLLILKEKKNLYLQEMKPYIIISMMVEMMIDENLEITDKNKVKLTDKEPTVNYNKKLYEVIKNIFSKYEREEIKSKLKEIKDTEIAKKVKVAQKTISFMIADISTAVIVGTGPT